MSNYFKRIASFFKGPPYKIIFAASLADYITYHWIWSFLYLVGLNGNVNSMLLGSLISLVIGGIMGSLIKSRKWVLYFLLYPYLRNLWFGFHMFLNWRFAGCEFPISRLLRLYLFPQGIFEALKTKPGMAFPHLLSPYIGAGIVKGMNFISDLKNKE